MSEPGGVDDWNAKVIAEFRANGGKVGGRFEGAPMILVHHYGARSGVERVALAGGERDEKWAEITDVMPGFADYQAKVSRVIPVPALTRV